MPLKTIRNIITTHPLHSINIKIPLMPNSVECSEKHTMFWVNPEMLMIVIDVDTKGAPFTSAFSLKYVHKIY